MEINITRILKLQAKFPENSVTFDTGTLTGVLSLFPVVGENVTRRAKVACASCLFNKGSEFAARLIYCSGVRRKKHKSVAELKFYLEDAEGRTIAEAQEQTNLSNCGLKGLSEALIVLKR